MKIKTFTIIAIIVILLVYTIPYRIEGYRGISMCPNYGRITITLEKNVKNTNELVKGDIYTYQTFIDGKKTTISHRYIADGIEIDGIIDGGRMVLFKGDNPKTNSIIEAVPEDAILYKMIWNLKILKCKRSDYGKNKN